MAVIKTISWFNNLQADHVRIGISRGTPHQLGIYLIATHAGCMLP